MIEMIKARKEELQKRGVSGFTLMEMLIVIAIIAILVAIAIPVFTSQLNNAHEQTDAANIRSGYAVVSANVLTTPPAAQTTYTLNADGTATTTATTAYSTQGAGTETIGGQSLTWTASKTVKYTYNPSTTTITIAVS